VIHATRSTSKCKKKIIHILYIYIYIYIYVYYTYIYIINSYIVTYISLILILHLRLMLKSGLLVEVYWLPTLTLKKCIKKHFI